MERFEEVWSLEGWGRNFEEALIWKVGTGKEVLFWEDNWMGRRGLEDGFPEVVFLECDKSFCDGCF